MIMYLKPFNINLYAAYFLIQGGAIQTPILPIITLVPSSFRSFVAFATITYNYIKKV